MTLNASGPIGIGNGVAGQDIALEFGLSASAVFPTAFYGKGGAPGSGALSFADFYGRANAHTATLAPNPTEGFGSSTPVDSANATCTVGAGVGPFTYSYVRVSGSTAISALSPSSATTAFRASPIGIGVTLSADFRCDVTDTGNGNLVVQSNVITVNITRS